MRQFLSTYIFRTRTIVGLIAATAFIVTAFAFLIPSPNAATTALIVAVSIPSVFISLTAAYAAGLANTLVSRAIESSQSNRVL